MGFSALLMYISQKYQLTPAKLHRVNLRALQGYQQRKNIKRPPSQKCYINGFLHTVLYANKEANHHPYARIVEEQWKQVIMFGSALILKQLHLGWIFLKHFYLFFLHSIPQFAFYPFLNTNCH
jgi:hypothetical protein